MTSSCSVDFVKRFDKYMEFLWHENGKLSEFWLSYLDMVKILSRLLRTLKEGNWELNVSTIRNMIDPMVLCIPQYKLCKIFILLSFRNVSPWRRASRCSVLVQDHVSYPGR